MIRIVSAVGLVLILGVGGCTKEPAEGEPKPAGGTEVEQPEEGAGAQAKSSPIPGGGADTAKRPSWVDNPASFYTPPRPDMLLAVGTAKIMAPGAEGMARTMAGATARANLSSAAGSDQVKKTVGNVEGTDAGETIVRVTHSGTVRGVQELASWTSPDQVLYILVGMKKPGPAKDTK